MCLFCHIVFGGRFLNLATCKVFRFLSGQPAKRCQVSCPAGASGRCPSITTVSCNRSQRARPTRQGWPRREAAVHLRVPTRFADGMRMAGLIDVFLHWFSIAFLKHKLRSYGVSMEFSTGMFTTTHRHGVSSWSRVCIFVSSSHGDLNEASRATCRSLAPFWCSGVGMAASGSSVGLAGTDESPHMSAGCRSSYDVCILQRALYYVELSRAAWPHFSLSRRRRMMR